MNRPVITFTLTVLSLVCTACGGSSSNSGGSGSSSHLPGVGTSFVNPNIGGDVTRLSDSDAGNSIGGRHITRIDYSRVQVENADSSLLLVHAINTDGLLQYALLPPKGGTPEMITLPDGNPSGQSNLHDETEARWHPIDPNIIRFIKGQNSYSGGLQVFEYAIAENSVSLLADLSGKLPSHWGDELYGMTNLEGTYSRDGNRLAWSIESGVNNAENTVGYVAFDVRNGGQVLGTLDYDGRDHDHISISPSGQYLVISAKDKTTSHPVDFSQEQLLMNETQHSDLCVTADGEDCYVSVSFDDVNNPNDGWVFVADLATGQSTRLLNIFATGNTSLHLSARAFDRPGWALMSTYNCQSNNSTAKCNRLSLIELKANPRIIDLTNTHSSGTDYYAEPQGTLSKDGLRAYFNSDWNQTSGVNAYRLDIPANTYAND